MKDLVFRIREGSGFVRFSALGSGFKVWGSEFEV